MGEKSTEGSCVVTCRFFWKKEQEHLKRLEKLKRIISKTISDFLAAALA